MGSSCEITQSGVTGKVDVARKSSLRDLCIDGNILHLDCINVNILASDTVPLEKTE